MTPALVLKGEFARLVGRTPQAVSNWIADGKLTAPALVGQGKSTRIHVDAALAQLKLTLDPGQQLAQAAPLLSFTAGERRSPEQTPQAPANDDAARLMRARADREELELRMASARAEEMAGRWVLAQAARDAWSAELAGFVQATESWLLTVAAREVASLETREPRAIGKVLRDSFRELRQRIAEKAAAGERRSPDESEDLEEDEAEAADELPR